MADSTDTPIESTDTTTTPVTAPILAPITPIAPITPVKLPINTVTSGATTTTVPLSTTSPSTSTSSSSGAPAPSTVAVTVPGVTGSVRFSLVVTDNLGVQSEAAYATVTIQGPPVAALTATPSPVAENGTITLSGAGSTSSGTITKYTFSLAPAT